ncbi:MAG TPA: hypothetical protein VKF60_01520 [Myxococcota bacterium]|nr:hypothetical protein [Myxococcota bacterium]
MIRRVSLAALVAVCSGCASWFDRIDYFDMPPRLEYQGFSFDRPPGPLWYMRPSEQSRTFAMLWRDRDPSKPSATHSFFAQISLDRLAAQPASAEEFAKLAEVPVQKALYQVREVSRQSEAATQQGQWCIRFETTTLQVGAPVAPDQELVLTLRGLRCLHPAFPKGVLTFYYSERGTREEIDPELSEEGETFLHGVRIDVAPGTPAT